MVWLVQERDGIASLSACAAWNRARLVSRSKWAGSKPGPLHSPSGRFLHDGPKRLDCHTDYNKVSDERVISGSIDCIARTQVVVAAFHNSNFKPTRPARIFQPHNLYATSCHNAVQIKHLLHRESVFSHLFECIIEDAVCVHLLIASSLEEKLPLIEGPSP